MVMRIESVLSSFFLFLKNNCKATGQVKGQAVGQVKGQAVVDIKHPIKNTIIQNHGKITIIYKKENSSNMDGDRVL